MRIFGLLLAAFAGLSLVTGVYAEDKKEEKKDEKKEVTLKGNLVCAKCALKEKGRHQMHDGYSSQGKW